MRLNHICMGCMSDKGEASVCPICGYREGTPAAAPHYLTPGSILAKKYLIGKGLGHGGFGTTYLAYDLVLGVKLAIKEYLPQDCAGRSPGQSQVTPFTGEGEKRFNQGLESFLQEARILARFDGQPGIVSVRDFFTENNTAYFVMNYLEGVTLKDVLVGRGGKPMPFEQLIKIMLPVMNALERVHAAGLLHRDVSPDNIFLTKQGQVVLIDFGAARQSMGAHRSMSVILKPGYAPKEQYLSHGRQGPWSDVYALGACMYRALTGIIPPEALERIPSDGLQPPSGLGIRMPRAAEDALLCAMAVEAEDRYQSVAAFRRALTGSAEPAKIQTPQQKKEGAGAKAAGGNRRQQAEPNTYPLKAKSKKSPAVGILIALLLLCLLAAIVVGAVVLLQRTVDGLPIPDFSQPTRMAGRQTPTENAGQLPDESPAATEKPEVQETPDADDPHSESSPGTTPEQALSAFVPRPYSYLRVESGETEEGWLAGAMPVSRPDVLSACFIYDRDTNESYGDVFLYFLDAVGNLKYGSSETQEYAILLPAKCEVGESFNGIYGRSEIIAVNYSAQIEDVRITGAVVIKTDQGYLFVVPDVGIALIREGMTEGETLQKVLSVESVDKTLFERFVAP